MRKLLISFLLVLSLTFGALTASASGTWVTKASLQTAKFGIAQGTVVHNGKIYTIGGYGPSGITNQLEVYDPSANSWTSKSVMPATQWGVAAAVWNNKIYTFGGTTNIGTGVTSNVFEYDITANTWTTKTNMALARGEGAAVTYNNKIYVLGGQSGNGGTVYGNVGIYDPATDTWTSGANMPVPAYDFAVGLVNGKIYAIGGWKKTAAGIDYASNVQIYDIATNTWTSGTPLTTANAEMGYAVNGSSIYLLGGSSSTTGFLEYKTATDSWGSLGSLTSARDLPASAFVNGYLYIIGGRAGSTPVATVQAYDIAGNTIPNAPANLAAAGGNASVALTWDSVSNATSYTLKRASATGGPYTTIAANLTSANYTDTSVTNGVTYFYVVTASNAAGESTNSNEASATPEAPVVTRALLTIIMQNGLEKEYDLSMTEVNTFISWYEAKDGGIGSATYAFDKTFNKGPFKTRTEYVAFSKILSFNVDEYEVQE